jgi:ankyrin repeat protein
LKWMFWIILWIASRRGHFEIVKYLIENKADINAQNNKGNTALILGKSTKFR